MEEDLRAVMVLMVNVLVSTEIQDHHAVTTEVEIDRHVVIMPMETALVQIQDRDAMT